MFFFNGDLEQFAIEVTINNWAASWQNQQSGMCAQRRLRSARTSAQFDQSSLCTQWVAKDPRFLHAAKTLIRLGGCPGWSVFAGRTCHFVGFVMRWLNYRISITCTPCFISRLYFRFSWLCQKHDSSCAQTPGWITDVVIVVCLGLTSLSTIVQSYHDGVWLRQGTQWTYRS